MFVAPQRQTSDHRTVCWFAVSMLFIRKYLAISPLHDIETKNY